MEERLFTDMMSTMRKWSNEKSQDVCSDFIECYSILLLIVYVDNDVILEHRHLYYFFSVSIFVCVCIQVGVHDQVSHGRVYLCLCRWRPEEDFRCLTLSLWFISLRKCLSLNRELGLWSVTSKPHHSLISVPSSTTLGLLVCSHEWIFIWLLSLN